MDAAVGKGKIGGIGNRATRPTSRFDRIGFAKQDRTRDIIVARLDHYQFQRTTQFLVSCSRFSEVFSFRLRIPLRWLLSGAGIYEDSPECR
jgi:hypothetical protein